MDETLVTILSLAVAVISMVVNAFVVRNQDRMQLAALKSRIDDSVIHWGERAIQAVAKAEFLAKRCGDKKPAEELREQIRAHRDELSALADAGRLFFPNEAPESQGAERAGAFKGVRPPILDAIVFSSILLGHLYARPKDWTSRSAETAKLLNDCRRLVVTELQNAIDPRQKERLLSQMREGRLDDDPSPYVLAKRLGAKIGQDYPKHPTMESWLDTHVREISSRTAEPMSNDLGTRFSRFVWRIGDSLMRAGQRGIERARRAKR